MTTHVFGLMHLYNSQEGAYRDHSGTNGLHHKTQEEGPDCDDLSVIQNNYRLWSAGLRRGNQLRSYLSTI